MATTERVDCLVIGAGVIGLAVARAVALAGYEVIVAEAARTPGTGTSSRNSEVIHAGIYYPQNSLKARFCVAGRTALYHYCRERSIPHKACGKLIVATDPGQILALKKLIEQAAKNGVNNLHWLTPTQVHAMEPAIHCVAAVHSPSSGILDSHAFMVALQGDAEHAGAVFAFSSPVEAGQITDKGIMLNIGGEELMELLANTVINCAGLHAVQLASRIQGLPTNHVPSIYFAKGNYYTLTGRSPFKHLIYPLPEQAGLGVHVTLDLGGQVRFGPDVEWVDAIDYNVDPRRAEVFYPAIRRYWPDLEDDALQPGYAGIRPKLQAPGQPALDFVIQGPSIHGVPGLINLFGIESPGLTGALAIADYILNLIKKIKNNK